MSITRRPSTIELCDGTVLFGILLETKNRQNLRKLRHPILVTSLDRPINRGSSRLTPTTQAQLLCWLGQAAWVICGGQSGKHWAGISGTGPYPIDPGLAILDHSQNHPSAGCEEAHLWRIIHDLPYSWTSPSGNCLWPLTLQAYADRHLNRHLTLHPQLCLEATNNYE